MLCGQLVERFQGVGTATTQREPRNEGNVLLPRTSQLGLPFAVFDDVHVLHRYDFHVFLGFLRAGPKFLYRGCA